MKVSVVIPCLNEAQTLAKAIGLARELVASLGGDGEVVVADNGSTDDSRSIAASAGARAVPVASKGYGFALLAGIRAAEGRVIVMGDADATYDFREAKPLVESVDSGACDLAMGSRLRGNIERGAMPFLHRYLGTPVLTFLIRLFFGLRITDCNCGMRAFSRKAFDRMHLVSGGMEFASEMLIKASLVGLRVTETPISLARDTRDRVPHLHTWRDGWRHLRFILLMAPHVVFQTPGTILAAVFGAATLALSLGPVAVAGINFDYHHLFYCVPLFCVGVQLLWFNAFAMHFRRFAGLDANYARRAESHFPLERWLVSGLLLGIAGFAVLALVLVRWMRAGRGELLAVRPCALGLTLLVVGILFITNTLMTSMLELTFAAGGADAATGSNPSDGTNA